MSRRRMLIGQEISAGGGYLPSAIRAYEYNESSGPVVDSIGGFQAVLGSEMSVGGGVLSTSNGDSANNKAVTNDPDIHISGGLPITIEMYFEISAGGSIPALATFKTDESASGVGLFASSISVQYRQFIIGGFGSVDINFNSGISYAAGVPYHLVLKFDGNVAVNTPSAWNLQINGTKFPGLNGGAVSSFTNENAIGWNAGTSNAAIDHKYLRIYNTELSDIDALSLFTNKDVEP